MDNYEPHSRPFLPQYPVGSGRVHVPFVRPVVATIPNVSYRPTRAEAEAALQASTFGLQPQHVGLLDRIEGLGLALDGIEQRGPISAADQQDFTKWAAERTGLLRHLGVVPAP